MDLNRVVLDGGVHVKSEGAYGVSDPTLWGDGHGMKREANDGGEEFEEDVSELNGGCTDEGLQNEHKDAEHKPAAARQNEQPTGDCGNGEVGSLGPGDQHKQKRQGEENPIEVHAEGGLFRLHVVHDQIFVDRQACHQKCIEHCVAQAVKRRRAVAE